MNEQQAREVALVRALDEKHPPDWQPTDCAWASNAAMTDIATDAQTLHADPAMRAAWLTARARRALERLRERGSQWAKALAEPRWRSVLGPALAAAALLSGLIVDSLAGGQRMNLVSPPFLALIAWNLFSYLLLIIDASRGGRLGPWPFDWGFAHKAHEASDTDGPLEHFARMWARRARPLKRARLLAWLHLAAALFAAGLITSLYWRGLATEYRAGWESTFLDAPEVATLLNTLLAPAAALLAEPLPDAIHIAALRFSAGDGENAARWIHLFAVTLLGLIILPRLALGIWQATRVRRLQRDFPWPLDDGYVRRLLPAVTGGEKRGAGVTLPAGSVVAILPYGHTPPESSLAALQAAMPEAMLYEAWQLGDEDDRALPTVSAGQPLFVLFALTATPEAEHHGRVLERLAADGSVEPRILIDETRFRERFAADEQRLNQRRDAWRRFLGDARPPVFLSLGTDQAAEIRQSIMA